ncbi:MAG TPA: stalk domain-containing protein [Armatimonadota bacterium]|nr:stalk domain-containing protein [Armatimonadota bacterium]
MNSRTAGRFALPALLTLFGVLAAGGAAAQTRGVVPADTVIRAKLDESVSSRNARIGDHVTASVTADDRSGFPDGTRFEGTITEVERASKDEPGVLDMRFRNAILPDGRRVAIDGRLASLSDDDVRRTSDGRLESRRRGGGGGKFDAKWVGYGAAGGAVLATIFGGGFLKGALLGGLGGAVYGYLNRDKNDGGRDRYRDVELSRGTEFGIRMNDRVAFDSRGNYRYNDRPGRVSDRVAGSREAYRFGTTTVRVNGRAVDFPADLRPMMVNGTLYVPLRPVAEAANLRFNHEVGDESFTFGSRRDARYSVGEFGFDRQGAEEDTGLAPIAINGEIYAPTEWLSRAGDMDVNWNRRGMRLDLDTTGARRER